MNDQELLRRVGPPKKWVIPASDIEQIMTTGACLHLLPSIEDCQECFVSALVDRQISILAERLGCTPDVAREVAARLRAKSETGQ